MKTRLLSLFVKLFLSLSLFSQKNVNYKHQFSIGWDITHFDDHRQFIIKEFNSTRPWLNLPTISYSIIYKDHLSIYFDFSHFDSYRSNYTPNDQKSRFVQEWLLFSSIGSKFTLKKTKYTLLNFKLGINNKSGNEFFYTGSWFGWHPVEINYQSFDFGPEIAIKGNLFLTDWLFISCQFRYVYYLYKKNKETSTQMYFIQPSIGFELFRKKEKN